MNHQHYLPIELGIALLVLTLFTEFEGIDLLFTSIHATVGLIVGLGLLGTGLAYIIYYYIVQELGAVTASSVTYIPPVVALLIGVVLVGEPIEQICYVATFLIFFRGVSSEEKMKAKANLLAASSTFDVS